jgi:phage shock protein B
MQEELIPILIVFIVVGIPVICGTLISLAKIMRGKDDDRKSGRRHRGHRRGSDEPDAQSEAELIQEIHRGLTRLENRIEALETIVISDSSRSPSRHE